MRAVPVGRTHAAPANDRPRVDESKWSGLAALRDAPACSNARPNSCLHPLPAAPRPHGLSPAHDVSDPRQHRDAMALLTEKALVNYEEQEGGW